MKKLERSAKKDIIFSVDAIQGLGAVRLDVEKFNIDFLASGTQKWLLGLQGLAFIYVRKELQDKMKSAPIGWLAVKGAWNLLDFDLTTKETAQRFQPGTLNNLSIYAFNSSMKLFKEFGFNEIEKQVLSNSKYFIDELEEIGYNSPVLSLPEVHLSGIVSFRSENAQKIFDNWGRIMMALGKSAARIVPDRVSIWIGAEPVAASGMRHPAARPERLREIMRGREYRIAIDLGQGRGAERVWTSDLSEEYVRINAKYTT